MKKYCLWRQFDADVKKIAGRILKTGKKFDGVWGPPRGGLPLAVCLSHRLNIPFLSKPKGKNTLIVDDIADTGKTLKKFADKGHFIATWFYHKQSKVVPQVWIREKKDDWIVFPWEAE